MFFNKLYEIESFHLTFHISNLDGIFHVNKTERTSCNYYVGTSCCRHLDTENCHTFFFVWLIEKHQTTAGAAE